MKISHQKHLLEIFQASLAAVNGRICVRKYLTEYSSVNSTHVVAIGKAASAMMLGAFDHFQDNRKQGLLITRHGHLDAVLEKNPQIYCIQAGHPVPDANSIEAGAELVRFISGAHVDASFLFLISGGASSLVEVLPDYIDLDELQRVNQWLLSSGLDIVQMNAIRQSISHIKGGRLLECLGERSALVLLISDVPGDDHTVIGSGLLVRNTLNSQFDIDLPDWIHDLLEKRQPMDENRLCCSDSDNVEVHVIACIQDAMQAATIQADKLGYQTIVHRELISGDTISVGEGLAKLLISEEHNSPVVHIWGGETTMKLPDAPGVGGRNQCLALAAAQQIKDDNRIALIAAGTDGTDGTGEDTGALVDGDTIKRGEMDDLDAQDCLNRADAGTFLQASGDLIYTGPTGTNVMDLVIGVKVSNHSEAI